MTVTRLLIVGNRGGTNVAESLQRAALQEGLHVRFCDAARAHAGPRWWRSALWRLARRPVALHAFSRAVFDEAVAGAVQVVLTTGVTAITAPTLAELRRRNIRCLHFSTDDPWSAGHRAGWFLRSLPAYDAIFTPRRANLEDLRRLGCARVSWLPFAFDPALFHSEPGTGDGADVPRCDVLFVGGADAERAMLLRPLMDTGLALALYGDYWDRYRALRPAYRGRLDPTQLRRVTQAAAVNLCICRASNRDGHVMRSFEIPAIGGFMLTQDTPEHRDLLGPDGECTRYFRSADDMVALAQAAVADTTGRRRMAQAAHARIRAGHHTYRDRLAAMLAQAH